MYSRTRYIAGNKLYICCFGIALALLGVVLVTPCAAHAADLSFTPPSGSYGVGGIFTVEVMVSSPDEALNVVSGVVSFPPDILSVISVAHRGSIIDFWVEEPTFSNTAGTVPFGGVVVSPGYEGSYGTVFAITFQAQAAGVAPLQFSESAVLANDGIGTNILEAIQVGEYLISIERPHNISETAPAAPLSTPLDPPVIEEYTEQIEEGDAIIVSGTTYPESTVDIWIRHGDGEPSVYTIESDKEGAFKFLSAPGKRAGIYTLWAEVIDDSGVHSEPSPAFIVGVRSPAYVVSGERIIEILSILVPVVALLLIAVLSVWYSFLKFLIYRKRMQREYRKTELRLEDTFDTLRDSITRELHELYAVKESGRKLTRAEQETLNDILEDLDDAEKYILCQFTDIKCQIDTIKEASKENTSAKTKSSN